MRRLIIAVAVALGTLAGAPVSAGTVHTPACARDLAGAETSLRKTLVRIQTAEKAGQEPMCAAFRDHADVVARAREVFSRCATDRDREVDVGQMDREILRTKFVIVRQCQGQEPKPATAAAASSS